MVSNIEAFTISVDGKTFKVEGAVINGPEITKLLVQTQSNIEVSDALKKEGHKLVGFSVFPILNDGNTASVILE